MQRILIISDPSELLSFDEACEAFGEFSEALRKSRAPKVNLTTGQVPPTRNPAPLGKQGDVNLKLSSANEFGVSLEGTPYKSAKLEFTSAYEAMYELQEFRTVARQLCVEHDLQQDATPIQTMIILSNLVKSLSAQIKNYEETPMPAPTYRPAYAKWKLGDTVQKKQGSSWRGKVVGFYSTEKTPIGYSVESLFEEGSVQVWPEAALIDWFDHTACVGAFGDANTKLNAEKPNVSYLTSIVECNDKITRPFKWQVAIGYEVIGHGYEKYHHEAMNSTIEFIQNHQKG